MIDDEFSRVKRFFYNTYSHVLGIDIREYAVNIVELDLRGAVPMLTNCAVEELALIPMDDANFVDSRSDVVNRFIRLNGISARHVFASVGGGHLYTREVQFPCLAGRELAEAVRWEAERYVPYETGAYYYDYAVLERMEGVRVFLAAASKSYIDALTAIFAKTSLRILAIEGGNIAMGRMVRMEAHAVVIDVDEGSSGVAFYQSGVPVLSRKVPFGFVHLTAQEEVCLKQMLENFIGEIMRIVESYERQYLSAVPGLYICGRGFECICEGLTRLFKLPVVPIPDASEYVCSPSLDVGYVRERMPQLTVAMGLALRGVRP